MKQKEIKDRSMRMKVITDWRLCQERPRQTLREKEAAKKMVATPSPAENALNVQSPALPTTPITHCSAGLLAMGKKSSNSLNRCYKGLSWRAKTTTEEEKFWFVLDRIGRVTRFNKCRRFCQVDTLQKCQCKL